MLTARARCSAPPFTGAAPLLAKDSGDSGDGGGEGSATRTPTKRNAPDLYTPEEWVVRPSKLPRPMAYGKQPKTTGVRPDAPAAEPQPEPAHHVQPEPSAALQCPPATAGGRKGTLFSSWGLPPPASSAALAPPAGTCGCAGRSPCCTATATATATAMAKETPSTRKPATRRSGKQKAGEDALAKARGAQQLRERRDDDGAGQAHADAFAVQPPGKPLGDKQQAESQARLCSTIEHLLWGGAGSADEALQTLHALLTRAAQR